MLSSRVHPFAALLAALFSVPAIAGQNDALQLYASVGWSHDDNLLRVADGDPGFDHRRGDSWLSAEGGMVFDHMYSRQRVASGAKLSRGRSTISASSTTTARTFRPPGTGSSAILLGTGSFSSNSVSLSASAQF